MAIKKSDIRYISDKCMTTMQAELDRVSLTLTGRSRELAERHATLVRRLTDEVATPASRAEQHLKRMGVAWN